MPDPLISVVIATRDRGRRVTHTVESALKNLSTYSNFEIIVVDQSADNHSQQAMQAYEDRPDVVYVRSHTKGLARARNLAIARAKGELIAITDDDCVVSESWLREICKAFRQYPGVSILFGNVLPGEHDSSAGFIPSYRRQQARVISRAIDKNDVDGIGACMALRKQIWQHLGGFDEMLGVGGIMQSSSEGDLVLQALYKGYQVCEIPNIVVVHNGFRSWEAGAALIERYWYGTGAMFGKHLKLQPVNTTLLLVMLGWRWAFGSSRVANSIGPNTQKLVRLKAFATGFFRGLATPVERHSGHFFVRPASNNRSGAR
ncbi:MAG: glycosyltransferase family A protein [Cyanobacteria bacterium J06607_10]